MAESSGVLTLEPAELVFRDVRLNQVSGCFVKFKEQSFGTLQGTFYAVREVSTRYKAEFKVTVARACRRTLNC
jgi:hypothetical protein